MPNLLVDNLSDDVFTSLEVQARRHHRSPEAEARTILEESLTRRRLLVHRVRAAEGEAFESESASPGPAAREALEVPQDYHRDLRRAVEILKRFGCKEVYLFGSLTDGQLHEGSDLDLAVRGCPPGQFFRAHGTLMMELDHPVDLVDLDQRTPFVQHLERNGELLRLE